MTVVETPAVAPFRRGLAFWQPRQPIFWLSAVLLLVYAAILLLPLVFGDVSSAGLTAATIIVGAQAIILWFVVRALPLFPRQPLSLRLFALALGAFFTVGSAVFLSAIVGTAIDAYGLSTFSGAISAPIVEDISRILGTLAVLTLASRQRITVMDGVVYGFLVGMGFELFESLQYAINTNDLQATLSVGLTRTLVGFGLHPLWTAVGAAALAYCLSRKQQGLSGRWLIIPVAMLPPMALHATWDFLTVLTDPIPIMFGLAFAYLLSLAGFFLAVRIGRNSEWEWFAGTNAGASITRSEWKSLTRAERRLVTQDL